jgi:hypothetical protein
MLNRRDIIFVLLLILVERPALCAGPAKPATPQGCVWSITGRWHEAGGAPLVAGALVSPGSFLSADRSTNSPSPQHLLILMPDGQRLYLDCQDQASCSRGFRLPALTQPVDDQMIATFAQVAAARRRESTASPAATESNRLRQPPNLLRFEAVATPDQDGSVNLAEALQELPPGSYHLVIDSATGVQEKNIHWDGSGDELHLVLRSNTLYHLHAYGTLNVERMRGSLLVTPPSEFAHLNPLLTNLRAALKSWNDRSPGWPIDDFLSLLLDAQGTASANL